MRQKPTKLAKKIILQNIFFGIVPLALFCLLFYVYIRQSFFVIHQEELWRDISNVSSNLDLYLSDIRSDLLAMSHNPIIRNTKKTHAQKLAELKKFKKAFNRYKNIVLLDSKKNVIVATDHNDKEIWQKKTWMLDALKNDFCMSPVYDLPDSSDTIIEFAVPVKDQQNKTAAILAAVVSMEKIRFIVKNYQTGDEGYALLLNRQGQIIAGSDHKKTSEALSSTFFSDRTVHAVSGFQKCVIQGRDYCYGYRNYHIRNSAKSFWTIIVIHPYEKAFWFLRYLGLFLFLSLIILGSIIIAGSLFQTKKILSPLDIFLDRIRQIHKGEMSVRTAIKTGDELEYLSGNFDAMIDSLEDAKKELEKKNRLLENMNEEIRQQLIFSEKISLIGKISSGLSHDFRNIAFLTRNYIQACIEEKNSDARQKLLLSSGEMVDTMLETINTLLYFARDQREHPETVSLKEILKKVVRIVLPFFEENMIKLETDYGSVLPVHIIENQIQQVICNILLNVKHAYGEAGGDISLALYEKAQQGQTGVLIEIKDHGKGMNEEEQEKIFQPFFSSQSFTGKIQGTGMGLYISKILTENSNGTIRVKSRPGSGTTVTLYFPGADQ